MPMNETIQTLLSRRSIRHFSDQPVTHEVLDLILQCGLYAASGGNHQVARFTVVDNKDVREALVLIARNEFRKMELVEGHYWNTAIKNAKNKSNYDFSFNAPILIIATAPARWLNGMADCAGALQNMQVAAAALGLGSCWVNQLHWLTANPVLRAYLKNYGISEEEAIFGSIVLGHPSRPQPMPSARKEGRINIIK